MKAVLGRERSLEGMLLVGQLFGMVTSIAIAHAVGPAGRGTLTTLAVWSQVLGWAACFSIDKAMVVLAQPQRQQLAPLSPDEALLQARSVLRKTVPLVCLASLFVGPRLFEDKTMAALLVFGVALTARSELWLGWFLARHRRDIYVAFRLLQPTMYLLWALTAAALLGGEPHELQTLVIALGLIVSLGLAPMVSGLRWPFAPMEHPAGTVKPLLRFAVSAHCGSALQYLNTRLDLLVLPLLASRSAVGIYAVGAAAGQLIVSAGSAGVVRGLAGRSERRDVSAILVAATLASLVVLTAPSLVPLLFGESFRASVPVTQVLAIGGIFGFMLQQGSGTLLGLGHTWDVARAQGFGALMFGFGILVSDTIVGIAAASMVSYFCALVTVEYFVRRAVVRCK